MSVVQGFSGNSQEILTGDFPCLHKLGGYPLFIYNICFTSMPHLKLKQYNYDHLYRHSVDV